MASPVSIADILHANHRWYHVIDLGGGAVTPGWLDLRPHRDVPPIPRRLKGKRALDCGTFDGFWAFELERRGAEVVALDIDEIPPPDAPAIHRDAIVQQLHGVTTGTGFELLKSFFGSSVRRVICNIYDVTPEAIGGPVDLAFIGALLLHLRDPVRALEAVRSSLTDGGTLVCFEPVSDRLGNLGHPAAEFYGATTPWTLWYPNVDCMLAWIHTAGYRNVKAHRDVYVVDGDGNRQHLVGFSATA